MKLYKLFAIAFLFISIVSCNMGERVKGNGNITTETRAVNEAGKIKVAGEMNVVINAGETGVRVEADENLMPYIITEVDGDWLTIKTKDNTNLESSKDITVYVTTSNLSDIKVSGSGDVSAPDQINSTGTLSLNISGSGNITMDVHTPKVEGEITGSGNTILSGETKDLNVKITGSGNFKSENLKAEKAEVKITGSGDASVFADEKLNVRVTGSGDVKYKGKAAVESKITGSGTVTKVN